MVKKKIKVEKILVVEVAEKLGYLEERAKRANLDDFDKILAKVPAVKSEDFDKI